MDAVFEFLEQLDQNKTPLPMVSVYLIVYIHLSATDVDFV